MSFETINIRDTAHPVKLIADDWALLSAGRRVAAHTSRAELASLENQRHASNSCEESYHWNTMTISWGGVGEMWGRDVAFVFVRPQRYTYQFMQQQDYFTLAFGLPKETLALCGKISGRDGDKIAQAGLTPQVEGDAIFPAQADLVLVCRKLHAQDIDSTGFVDPRIADYYDGDHHRMYIGEIVQCLRKTA
ncbi:MAG: flavin reductase [Oscillospiraceae bacterium]|nr:flavin reductase [Oscillospiraceae bacterium]